MFKKAVWRLTAWYLGVLFLISLLFSAVLYRNTTYEINYGLRPPSAQILSQVPDNFFSRQDIYEQFRASRVSESSEQVLINLIYFNIFVLALGGILSYLLAKHTLEPIEEAHSQQERFIANASHELRTPLSAMRSEIEVALRGTKLTDIEARELLRSNLEEVTKLSALSENLLQLSRYRNGSQKPKFSPVELNKVIEKAIAKLGSQIAAKKIKINQRLSNTTVSGEPGLLEELVTILLDNAIKYSPENKEVSIALTATDKLANLTVTDHGIGISAEDQKHIFDRFYRADTSRSMTHGYGLGLAIAQQIAELHRGKIRVTSTPKRGSSFVVTLAVSSEPDIS